MKIYVMRHGEAGYNASSDASRSLTPFGQVQCLSAANWLKSQNIDFDLGLVSPYLRAQQTYDIVKKQISINQTQTNKQLTPGGDADFIVSEISLLPPDIQSILVVSHLPLVGYLVNAFCPQINPPMFSTAELVCIEFMPDVNKGTVLWTHHPK